MKKNLTPKQAETLAHIVLYFKEHDRLPSQIELGEYMGKYAKTVGTSMKLLARHGYLEKDARRYRFSRDWIERPRIVLHQEAEKMEVFYA